VSNKDTGWKFDAAGWVFWLIVFVLLAGPCIFGIWKIVYATANRSIPIVTGLIVAAIGAGFISWAVNAVVQRRQKQQRIARRKKTRKQK
jgi:hypothetical protein